MRRWGVRESPCDERHGATAVDGGVLWESASLRDCPAESRTLLDHARCGALCAVSRYDVRKPIHGDASHPRSLPGGPASGRNRRCSQAHGELPYPAVVAARGNRGLSVCNRTRRCRSRDRGAIHVRLDHLLIPAQARMDAGPVTASVGSSTKPPTYRLY